MMADAMKLVPVSDAEVTAVHEALGGDGWAYSNYGCNELKTHREELEAVVRAVRAASPPAREEAPAEGAGELDKAVKRMRDQLVGSATFTSLSFGREDVRLVLDTLAALRNRTSEPEAGSLHLTVSDEHLEALLEAAYSAGAARGPGPLSSEEVEDYARRKLRFLQERAQEKLLLRPAPSESADKLRVAVEALEPFAREADGWPARDWTDEKSVTAFRNMIVVGDLRRAAAALAALSPKGGGDRG